MQLGWNVPRDEERQPRVPRIVVEAGAAPSKLSTVRAGADAGLDPQPKPSRSRIEVCVGQADSEPSIDAIAGELEQRSTKRRRAANKKVDHRDQLEVGIAKRHDAVSGSPTWMHTPGHRRQSMVTAQPLARLVEIRHGEHHMIDRVHGPPATSRTHRVISRYRRTMRRIGILVAIVVLVRVLPLPADAVEAEPRPILEGLAFPTNMAFLPDGTLLFTEKETGSVRVVTPDRELLDPPFITLSVMPSAERGLLGIAVHPDFDQEPWIYLYYSDPADGLNRLVRVRADGVIAAGEPETLLDGISAVAGYHNGGDLVFAPDGTLFVALGEAHDPDRAQDEDDIGGKVVRLTAEGGVPEDNPFGAGNPVWSIGHRNSFGLCVDPRTGELWETENGPNVDDEVNLILAGANYGWPVVTGRADDDRYVDPIVVFPTPIALTGCSVADDDVWFGSYDGKLWRLESGARNAGDPDEIASFQAGVTDVAHGPDGTLYVATANAIWTTGPPLEKADEGGAWRAWIAGGAIAVLVGALGVRFVAGRRLRNQGPSDRET